MAYPRLGLSLTVYQGMHGLSSLPSKVPKSIKSRFVPLCLAPWGQDWPLKVTPYLWMLGLTLTRDSLYVYQVMLGLPPDYDYICSKGLMGRLLRTSSSTEHFRVLHRSLITQVI